MFLLLLTAGELYACEVLAPEQCESFGNPQDGCSQQNDDKCICCCAHVLLAQPMVLEASSQILEVLDFCRPMQPEQQSFSIYHPPKA